MTRLISDGLVLDRRIDAAFRGQYNTPGLVCALAPNKLGGIGLTFTTGFGLVKMRCVSLPTLR